MKKGLRHSVLSPLIHHIKSEKHRPDEEGIATLQLSSPLPGRIYVGNRDLTNKGLRHYGVIGGLYKSVKSEKHRPDEEGIATS